MSRALLTIVAFTGFILVGACDGQPGPAGPGVPDALGHHAPGHGGGNKGDGDKDDGDSEAAAGEANIHLAGAMTATYHAAVRENRNSLSASTGTGGPGVTLAFTGAHGAFQDGGCNWKNEPDAATAEAIADQFVFDNGQGSGGMSFEIDKRALGQASSGHDITHVYENAELGYTFRVSIFAHGDPPPTVHLLEEGDGQRTFRFSGGVARVWRVSSPARNDVRLFCGEHGDFIDVTILD